MKRTQLLLIKLMEEAAEIQQAASKSLQFGWWNHHPDRPDTNNMQELSKECGDIRGVMEMLADEAAIDWEMMQVAEKEKPAKVEKYLKLSAEIAREAGETE